jgi:hypothetical protein
MQMTARMFCSTAVWAATSPGDCQATQARGVLHSSERAPQIGLPNCCGDVRADNVSDVLVTLGHVRA